jgi:uncharacterized protein YlxP (DUF503 family)
MPINSSASKRSIIREIMHSYKQKGTIGTSTPASSKKARKQAIAIAFSVKRKKRRKK